MKKLLILLLLPVYMNCPAQIVFNHGTKWGILFQSGEPALNAEYDAIYRVLGYNGYACFCKKDGKFGLYLAADSSFTGCRFDTIFKRADDIIYFRVGRKLGFLGYDESSQRYHIIEPQYDEVMCFGSAVSQYDTNGKIIQQYRPVSAQLDSLWGVLDFSTGETRVRFKYRDRIDRVNDYNLFASGNYYTDTYIVIEPFTQVEFHMPFATTVYSNPDNDLLYGFEKLSDFPGWKLHVWQYSTGTPLWSYDIGHRAFDFTVYSDQIIAISETVDERNATSTIEWHFFNFETGAPLLSFVSDPFKETVDVVELPEQLVIGVRKAKSGKEIMTRTLYKY